MLPQVKNTLAVSRSWVMLAAVSAAGWAVIGYHENQMLAQAALDAKMGRGAGYLAADSKLSTLKGILLSCAAICLGIAGFVGQLKQRGDTLQFDPAANKPQDDMQQSNAFQPIRKQEEILKDADETRTPQSRPVSRILTQVSRKAIGIAGPIKNRQ